MPGPLFHDPVISYVIHFIIVALTNLFHDSYYIIVICLQSRSSRGPFRTHFDLRSVLGICDLLCSMMALWLQRHRAISKRGSMVGWWRNLCSKNQNGFSKELMQWQHSTKPISLTRI